MDLSEELKLPINEIPENVKEFMGTHYCTIDISICATDAINHYGMLFHPAVELKMYEKVCSRCGCSDVFSNPFDDHQCQRHTWGKRQWTDVFVWTPRDNDQSIEQCFEDWKELNKRA